MTEIIQKMVKINLVKFFLIFFLRSRTVPKNLKGVSRLVKRLFRRGDRMGTLLVKYSFSKKNRSAENLRRLLCYFLALLMLHNKGDRYEIALDTF